ncbi:MAG TPA: GvpL/GvpF family gas vesicle protein [Acidimicrobiales bacterium]|nr:GvpL/GvpF family gas vesicle protein [Acidimicrobiales bacterium]
MTTRPVSVDGGLASRLYVYAIVPVAAMDLSEMEGLAGRAVHEVRQGPLAALVSAIEEERLRPTRANLSAHQQVVSSAHSRGPALPVRFGTVFPDEETLRVDLLAPEQLRLEAMLADFEGKDEFRVKCRYLPDVAIREVVERSPSIRKLRARADNAASPATRQAQQVRLGEIVMLELERLRERDAATVVDGLAPHILSWEPIDDPSDDVPLHAAFLVDRRRTRDLESALEEIASRQKDRMQVELIGPLPLWDFSHVSAGVA